MLQQRAKIQWLKGGDQCSKIFFCKVAARRASLKVFHITNGQGTRLANEHDVVAEFISFFEKLLGGQRQHRFLDVTFLRPWARHVLTAEEAALLVDRSDVVRLRWQFLLLRRTRPLVLTGSQQGSIRQHDR
ncbi:UNVERIFIED_CONTAM: hypothetical protein Slati_3116900 [Sesamum latifolium]|uniref:Uncharacterized protein n=1 Tax=Sesamum latifolium TaxID=2727402 RepID=A0AAW2UU63_9LAMI